MDLKITPTRNKTANNLCSYGCNKTAKAILKNKKYCCEYSANKCPAQKKKNSESRKGWGFFNVRNPHTIIRKCSHCSLKVGIPNIKKHEKNCYLNPENKKICPICKKPIKNFRHTTTCSHGCANSYFRSLKNNPNWKDEAYVSTCFYYHKKECIICKELNKVEVHHYDKNKKNNKPENLIPLCPTHHKYMHSKFKRLIIKKVIDFRKNAKLKNPT